MASRLEGPAETAYAGACMARRYGENFRQIRAARGLKQEQLMVLLNLKRQGPISLIETSAHVPRPATIRRHAAALKCKTWELLEGVETEYDVLRRREEAAPEAPPFSNDDRRHGKRRSNNPDESHGQPRANRRSR